MQVTVKLFARFREDYGFQEKVLTLPRAAAAGEVWRLAVEAAPPPNILCAVNHAYAALDAEVGDGDEVGFFPPVNGG